MADESKTRIVCVRVTPTFYAELEKAADLARRTLSDFARLLWEDALQAREQETTDAPPHPMYD